MQSGGRKGEGRKGELGRGSGFGWWGPRKREGLLVGRGYLLGGGGRRIAGEVGKSF